MEKMQAMEEETSFSKVGIRRLVLIVDDEHVNRRILGRIIEKEYDVIYAENGQEAYEQIKKRENTLSMILLDLIMPVMDGYQLMALLREDPKYSKIPVIVLTAERTAEAKSLQIGASDFIPKPYDMPEVILARVKRLIELAEDKTIISAIETDALTGLYTKEFFCQHAIIHDNYYPDMPMDAVVLNVNRFHLINELYGRLFGDKVISTIADQLKSIVSETDGIAGRAGSDSFFIYIRHNSDYSVLLDRIVNGLINGTGNSSINLRMGVYQNVDKNTDPEHRFDRAQFACNTIRSGYTNGFVLYDDTMYKRELYSNKLIDDMHVGVENRQFKVYYQPKFDIIGDKPVLRSAEALIRWDHPEYGMVPPGSFVPLFEENGLVQKLDRFVWEEAAAQAKRWKEKFGVTIPVSVNVSRLDIYDPELEKRLLSLVERNGIDPTDYVLEITESAYTDNSEQIIDTVNKLRAHGFRIEMDDFGAGYSSLNMVAALPIDALKLDTQLIRKIDESEKELRMVQLIIDIAGFMKISVIAEGVENEKQYQLLKEAGCSIIQGFYFSKPVLPEEFERLIEEKIRKTPERGTL